MTLVSLNNYLRWRFSWNGSETAEWWPFKSFINPPSSRLEHALIERLWRVWTGPCRAHRPGHAGVQFECIAHSLAAACCARVGILSWFKDHVLMRNLYQISNMLQYKSGRTGSALVWHSEGRLFDPHWVQQVLRFVPCICTVQYVELGGYYSV